MKKGFILLVLLVGTGVGVFGQNRFWVAGSTGNWNDPANRRACYVQGLADLNFSLSRQRNFVSFYKPMFRNPNRKGCPSYPPIGRVPPTMLTCRAGR